ncbi:threonine dehydratase [Dendronalium sp. ChiSLP03b]|uniref:threonine dehydratase n=1 Tax=Dendronalium sp. ChiSLP03b TaxID=3075381 RepID=UPI002AD5A264|nr:threonine dehydratase [Dendronalium sp. ChiSLP03b]MDZ8204292.1 threonine dehydratase [Dendronalium sp. ChiSLP03b]
MFRLPQIIQNLFLRVEGFFSVVFNIFWRFTRNFFGFFANLFGFNSSEYFLESNESQSVKQASAKQQIEAKQDAALPETPANSRRRPNTKMDYYLNMARDLKKK